MAIFSSVHFSLDARKFPIKNHSLKVSDGIFRISKYVNEGIQKRCILCTGNQYEHILRKSIRGKLIRIWIRNTAFFLANLQICGLGHKENVRTCGLIITNLRICGFEHLRNLRIWNCGMIPRICVLVICGLTNKICVATFEIASVLISSPPHPSPPPQD